MRSSWQDQPEISPAQLGEELSRLGIRPGMEVMVHLSLSALGKVAGGAPAVIGALEQAVSPGGVLLLPAFTLYNMTKFDEAFEFDVRSAPVDVGKIPEAFRSMPGVARSIHPTHSLCAWGENRDLFLQAPATTGFGDDSAFDLLVRRNGYVLLLGVGFRSCTLVHYVEAITGVPYREFAGFPQCTIVDHQGRRYPCTQKVYRRRGQVSLDLDNAGKLYLSSGHAIRGKIGMADAILVDMAEFTRMIGAAMRSNPELLLQER